MSDPRLNSVHLDQLRRQDFRRARESLLGARGEETLAGENMLPQAASDKTMMEFLDKQAPGAKFVLMDRDYVYTLKVGLNTVGRLPDNDLVLDDAYVSRRHCAILVHADSGCEIHDVASKNGIWVNGQKINGPHKLVSGDEIRLSSQPFIFLVRDSEAV